MTGAPVVHGPGQLVDSPSARFDDLQAGGSIVLTQPAETLVARTPAEVAPTLRAAESAARNGAWVAGFVAYEAAAGLDPGLTVSGWPVGHPLSGLPLVWFAAFDGFDVVPPPDPPNRDSSCLQWTFDRDERWHEQAVRQARCAIARGDYYQANLTLRARTRVRDRAWLYAHLVEQQRGAFHTELWTGEYAVLSASPELFFSRDGDTIVTRPMKGTARRGADPSADRRLAAALLRSAKERAENVMIVDLLRNDLGRIALPGEVRVRELLRVEPYPTVWQLTSSVTARIAPELGLVEMFSALFPSGSVTGAPKRAAMAAIAAIEGRARGVYCGAIGYLRPGRPPAARFSVAIRTVTVGPGDHAEYGVGGGITYSSRPDAEWQEVLAKSAVLTSRGRAGPGPFG